MFPTQSGHVRRDAKTESPGDDISQAGYQQRTVSSVLEQLPSPQGTRNALKRDYRLIDGPALS